MLWPHWPSWGSSTSCSSPLPQGLCNDDHLPCILPAHPHCAWLLFFLTLVSVQCHLSREPLPTIHCSTQSNSSCFPIILFHFIHNIPELTLFLCLCAHHKNPPTKLQALQKQGYAWFLDSQNQSSSPFPCRSQSNLYKTKLV